ncbi:hypothetical protein JCM10207_005814 [Rhodosporidiobolus poonsookiae]
MPELKNGDTDWSVFKEHLPSQDVHAPPGSPPAKTPSPAAKTPSPAANNAAYRSSSSPSPPGEASSLPRFSPLEAPVRVPDGAPTKPDARQRVLAKLGLEGEEKEQMKMLGLGLEVPRLLVEQEEFNALLGVQPPSPPPLTAPRHSPPLSPDPSIPLHARLAGRAEALAGKLLKKDHLVLDGTVRRFGPEATLTGEIK